MKKYCLLLLISMFMYKSYGQVAVEAHAMPAASVVLLPSWVKERESLNIKYVRSLDPDRLLHNFRVQSGLPSNAKPLEGWESPRIGLRGHFVGHYLSATASIIQNYHDTTLTRKAAYLVAELAKCQQASGAGYLSAFPQADFDKLEAKFDGVWAPYYTYHKIMQGMLDQYTKAGNRQAYQIVLAMAEYTAQRMSRLSPATIDRMFYTVQANPANEAGAMNEVLYELYQVSKDPKHLALARLFDPEWFAAPMTRNEDILSGLHSNTHLVLINGFAKRYEVTGEARYHNAALNFWNMLTRDHAYANGSSSGPRPNVTTTTSATAEHWSVPGQLSNTMSKEIAESCVTHNTQKLTSTLFTWDPQPRYAEAYMNTYYNGVMALQSASTGAVVYHLPLGSPRKKAWLKENDFKCCNGSSIEAFAALNTAIYYQNSSNLWVNLYVPSKFDWREKGVHIQQSGNFPADSAVELTIKAKKRVRFKLNLLMPEWADGAEVYLNGIKEDRPILASTYFGIEREWKNTDRIKVVFSYNFRLKTMPDDKNVFAVYYGPTLLAFEHAAELIFRKQPLSVLKHISRVDADTFMLNDDGKKYIMRPFYLIDDQIYGVYATARDYKL